MKNQHKIHKKIISFRLTTDEYKKFVEYINQFEGKNFSKRIREAFRQNGVI